MKISCFFKSSLSLLMIILFASITTAHTTQQLHDFQSGDIILLPVDCKSCTMIEEETGTIYSHSGIVLKNPSGELFVAESSTHVSTIPLSTFLSFAEKGQKARLMRPKELAHLGATAPELFAQFEKNIWQAFVSQFKGLPFDEEYIWGNVNEELVEKLYCSEFITKLLNIFLRDKINPKPMSFSKHYSYWYQYFHGRIPEGELGNAPADFFRSPLLIDFGDIDTQYIAY
ncbi:MAG: hypothetical protein HQK52_21095 [Oligoflexia bacterium]|nr:hypothetical protein [Oligoflexia bacterium]